MSLALLPLHWRSWTAGLFTPRREPSQPLSAAVDQAACSDSTGPKRQRAAVLKAEVLLDRLALSPGIVDGKAGENAGKTIAAFQRSRGLAANGKLD